jgi:hypothetical protein
MANDPIAKRDGLRTARSSGVVRSYAAKAAAGSPHAKMFAADAKPKPQNAPTPGPGMGGNPPGKQA